MKNVIIIILAILSYSTAVFAEWQRQSFPGITFNKVYFLNETTGLTVGNNGVIFKTTNSGTNWLSQNSPTTRNLSSIALLNNGKGLIGGEGIILMTNNFGQSWTTLQQWSSLNPCADTLRIAIAEVIHNALFVAINSLFTCNYGNRGEYFSVNDQLELTKLYEKPHLLYRTIPNGAGYMVTGATVTNFGPTYHIFDLDNSWASSNERNYSLCNSGFFTLTPSLAFYGYHAFTPASASQTFFNPQNATQLSEWYYFQQTPYWTTERGYEYLPNDMALSGNAEDIYVVGWNNYDRDNRNNKSCIKRFNIAEDRIYTEYEEEYLSLYSVYATTSNVFAAGNGVILRRDNLTGMGNNSQQLKDFSLQQNFPNPFNPVTKITFSLAKSEKVTLKITNLIGQTLATLVDEPMSKGQHVISFDGTPFASGVYLYTLQSGDRIITKKMTLVK